jgi:transposase
MDTPRADAADQAAAWRAENAALREALAQQQRANQELLKLIADLQATVAKQQATIERLTRVAFGRKSERWAGPTLFDNQPEPAAPSAPAKPDPPAEDRPKRRPGAHGRSPLPPDLRRERVELEPSAAERACPACGTERVRIGEEVSERLDFVPASLFVRQTVRPTYCCRACEQAARDPQFLQPPLPPEALPRAVAAAGLLAHLMVSKYVDHVPLHRLESILARHGWAASRSTLCDHLMGVADLLRPLVLLMSERVRAGPWLHADDTPIKLLAPERTAHAWVYVGSDAQPYTVFDLAVGRSGDAPEAFLQGYKGFLHADAYGGYNALYAGGAQHVGCWMHARRYFYDARNTAPAESAEALARVAALYAIERAATDAKLVGEARRAYRQQHAAPLVAAFAEWLAAVRPRALPKSPLGEAVTYATNQWPTLLVYLTDGRLNIDNGPAERAIRPLALGRKNWLHIARDTALPRVAVLLSLAASAKRCGLNPWAWFRDLLVRVPALPPAADLSPLLPDAWNLAQAA